MKSEETKPTGRASDKFMLRLPDGLREKIAQAAVENKRSMNAEIVARIEQTLNAGTSLAPPLLVQNFDDLMTEFMRRYNIAMEAPVAIKPPPEFADQADDIPSDPPKRRIKLNRKA